MDDGGTSYQERLRFPPLDSFIRCHSPFFLSFDRVPMKTMGKHLISVAFPPRMLTLAIDMRATHQRAAWGLGRHPGIYARRSGFRGQNWNTCRYGYEFMPNDVHNSIFFRFECISHWAIVLYSAHRPSFNPTDVQNKIFKYSA